MKFKQIAILALFFFLPSFPSSAYWVWSPEQGKFVNPEGAGSDSAEEQYDYAMQFYKEKNLDEAIKQLEELLKKYPAARVAGEGQYRLGTILEEKGEYLKAFEAYKNLVQSYPQSERFKEVIEREFRIGNLFLSGKKAKLLGLEILPSLPRAIEIFQHIVKHAPFSEYGDKAQFQLGLSLKQAGRYQDSADAFQALIDDYPKSDLVTQARYELAETSFLRSKTQFRDQRALDEASTQVDRFLTHHPSEAVSEQAAKLRQVIDEKNAEKNFRVGLFYEKENYLDSALIYYSDVSARYPHTGWGKKASDKLKSLKQPADFISQQKKALGQQIQTTQAQLKAAPATDHFEQDRLKRQLERLEKREQTLEKDKKESLERRRQDLKRRKSELQAKFKNLQVKQKLTQTNPSQDFKRALERWHASLEAESESLVTEEKRLKEWYQELGVAEKKSYIEYLPFIKEPPSAIEKVRRVEAKKLFQLSEEKKFILEEKETLYKHHSEIESLLNKIEGERFDQGADWAEKVQVKDLDLRAMQKKLQEARSNLGRLESELDQKSDLYEKHFGKTSWFTAPTQLLASLNPFDGLEKLQHKSLQELLERQMHLKESIATQQSLTETLAQAFDEALALQEQKRLLKELDMQEKPDPRLLRKSIKRLQKDIRQRYQEIEDRHERKKKVLSELDSLLEQKKDEQSSMVKAARAVTAPARGFGRFWKVFLFGLPDKGVELSRSAARVPEESADSDTIRSLKDEVELESLLIEAKSQEIIKLQKELEILKAKAALAGGFKFRSSFVTVPYQFVGEAIESAKRVVPKKNREEIIIHRLNDETERLEGLKNELGKVEEFLQAKSAAAPEEAAALKERASSKPESEAGPVSASRPDETALRDEIQALTKRIETEKEVHKKQKDLFEEKLRGLEAGQASQEGDLRGAKEHKELLKQQRKLERELVDIKDNLSELIQKESKLEVEESSILEKRISQIDREMPKTHSKAVSQDLLTERSRMEERVSQLESRRNFLSKELERFGLVEAPAASRR